MVTFVGISRGMRMNEPNIDKTDIPDIGILETRRPGDTSFQICGWCEHGGTGYTFKGCMVKGRCGFIPMMPPPIDWDKMEAGLQDLDNYSRLDLKHQIKILEGAIARNQTSLSSNNANRAALKKMIKSGELGPDVLDWDGFDFDESCRMEFNWDTSCPLLAWMPNPEYQHNILERYSELIRIIKRLDRVYRNNIKKCRELMADAPDAPPYPVNCPYDYFTDGELVRFVYDGVWRRGRLMSAIPNAEGFHVDYDNASIRVKFMMKEADYIYMVEKDMKRWDWWISMMPEDMKDTPAPTLDPTVLDGN